MRLRETVRLGLPHSGSSARPISTSGLAKSGACLLNSRSRSMRGTEPCRLSYWSGRRGEGTSQHRCCTGHRSSTCATPCRPNTWLPNGTACACTPWPQPWQAYRISSSGGLQRMCARPWLRSRMHRMCWRCCSWEVTARLPDGWLAHTGISDAPALPTRSSGQCKPPATQCVRARSVCGQSGHRAAHPRRLTLRQPHPAHVGSHARVRAQSLPRPARGPR